SGLWRVNSGLHFSYLANSVGITDIQQTLISAYPDQPSSQNVYYGERGIGEFKGYGVLDFDVSYNIPVFRTVKPWLKFDVFNLFDNQKLIAWNTTVHPDPNSP